MTDSNSAKDDILRYYNVPIERIVVVPCAWQHFDRIAFNDTTLEKYDLKEGQYYFAMGSFDPNKNFKWIAEAAKKNKDGLFAIAGSINDSVFAKKIGFDSPTNMKLLGYVTDEEAKTLMRYCKAFLFPSFCEGFGMPPLEALSAGAKAIVVSDIPVMHAMFGELATYINPNEVCMNFRPGRSINDFQKEYVLNKFSWKKSAELVYSIIK